MEFTSGLKTYFRIRAFTIITRTREYMASAISFSDNAFLLNADIPLNFFRECKLQITLSNGFILLFDCTAVVVGIKKINVKIKIENITKKELNYFLKRLKAFEGDEKEIGRRGEPRQRVTTDERINLFGLAKKRQKILFLPSRIEQECFLVDVSLHGFKAVTELFGKQGQTSAEICMTVKFRGYPQEIIFTAEKKSFGILKNQYIAISGKIKEPVPYIWQERVMHLIESS